MAADTRGMTVARVTLRHVVEADVATFFGHQADPEAAAMADFPSRDQDAHAAHWRRILADPTVLARTILADGQVAGNIVSWEQDGQREVGYWIARELWGRGVATRALAAFLAHERERPLHARVALRNVGSLRVLAKCGFRAVEAGGEHDPEERLLRLDPGQD
jgi:RimJ/RimL family protein N-acetyltransferase